MKRFWLTTVAALAIGGAAVAQTPPSPQPAPPAPTPEQPAPEPVAQAGPATTSAPTQTKPEKPKWDVQNPAGPRETINFDVTEGTWMTVDVSPDGRQIVFDLLGDIYVMPIGGGEARNIASGVAWDMQPKWSPDGTKIAFTSDRAGGDNIWVMNADGSGPVQVSKEDFRLVTQPDWSPDGEFIVGRKHFTSGRSLGAGEMWMWHRAGGGSGVQLTERRTEQKDTGEPAFSPDGRYLYFSDDATPGETFEYSKDPTPRFTSFAVWIVRPARPRSSSPALAVRSGPSPRRMASPSPSSGAFATSPSSM